MGTLPKELNQIGADARVIMPFHSQMKGKYGAQTRHLADFNINFSGGETYVGVEELVYNEVTYYLIDNEGFFGDAVYRGGLAEGEQYAFFCRAVIEAASRIGFIPDVIHCNDWQTGLIPVFLHTVFGDDNFYAGIKTVFTIHNLQFQGRWRIQEIMDITGLPAHIFNAYELESYGEANYLKGGVVYADYITTVSPTYANEITTVEGGEGLSGLMTARKDRLYGILNGIDYEEYILEITAQDANLKNIGLEKAVQTILAVRFGNVKCVDKADITGIINTIRQVRSYALKKARGLKKLVVCLI